MIEVGAKVFAICVVAEWGTLYPLVSCNEVNEMRKTQYVWVLGVF